MPWILFLEAQSILNIYVLLVITKIKMFAFQKCLNPFNLYSLPSPQDEDNVYELSHVVRHSVFCIICLHCTEPATGQDSNSNHNKSN